MDMLFHLFKHK